MFPENEVIRSAIVRNSTLAGDVIKIAMSSGLVTRSNHDSMENVQVLHPGSGLKSSYVRQSLVERNEISPCIARDVLIAKNDKNRVIDFIRFSCGEGHALVVARCFQSVFLRWDTIPQEMPQQCFKQDGRVTRPISPGNSGICLGAELFRSEIRIRPME